MGILILCREREEHRFLFLKTEQEFFTWMRAPLDIDVTSHAILHIEGGDDDGIHHPRIV